MLLQAAGLALIAGLSPTALLIAAVYLGSGSRMIAGFYLTGAVAVSVVIAIVALVVLRGLALSHPSEHSPRYELRLGLGIVLLAAGAVLAIRRRHRREPVEEKSGFLSRLVSRPSRMSAFVVGVLIFASCGAFLAAVQVVATAHASVELTTLALVLVVVINVVLVWLPVGLHLIAPEWTGRHLTRFNRWLALRGPVVVVWVLVVVGVILIANGIYGLS